MFVSGKKMNTKKDILVLCVKGLALVSEIFPSQKASLADAEMPFGEGVQGFASRVFVFNTSVFKNFGSPLQF